MTAPVRLTLSRRKGFDLTGYIARMDAASDAKALEAAIQSEQSHPWHGPTWAKICKARVANAERICAAHPNGRYIPRWGKGRTIELCGEQYKVGRAQNSAGDRYVWEYAKQWAVGIMKENGLSQRAAYAIWSLAFSYPHRAIKVVDDAIAGRLPDPPINVGDYPSEASDPI